MALREHQAAREQTANARLDAVLEHVAAEAEQADIVMAYIGMAIQAWPIQVWPMQSLPI